MADALNRKVELATVCPIKGDLLSRIRDGIREDPTVHRLVKLVEEGKMR